MRSRIRRDDGTTLKRHFSDETNPILPAAALPGDRRVRVVYQSPALELAGRTAVQAYAIITVRQDSQAAADLGVFSAIGIDVEGALGTVNFAPGAKNSAIYVGPSTYRLVVENLPNRPGIVGNHAVWILALENHADAVRYMKIEVSGTLVASERAI